MAAIKKVLLAGWCLFIYTKLPAQAKQITHANQVWYGYYPQLRLSKHYGLWADFELHQKDHFVSNLSQSVFRLAGTYYINDNSKLTAGYTFIDYYPAEKHLHISQPEHAGWQQVQWFTNYRKKKMMQWIRLEERFRRNVIDDYTLANSYTYTWRARYNIYYTLPLSKKGIAAHKISAAIGDEIYINFGKHIVNNYLDQNRIFLGFSYMVNSHDNLVFGYMNSFQQQPAGNQYKAMNVVRLSFFENIKLAQHRSNLQIRNGE